MSLILKQFSSLEKIRRNDPIECSALQEITALKGERISYQLVIKAEDEPRFPAKVWVESPLADAVTLYREKEVIVDTPNIGKITDKDYILTEAGFLPDVLIPMEEQNDRVLLTDDNALIWVRIDIPEDLPAGEYPVTIHFGVEAFGKLHLPFRMTAETTMCIRVLDAKIPSQALIYTRWLYLDCIADAHHVPIFSEAHWALIEQYIEKAHDVGINMLLLSVHTPPLDTDIGTRRPCVQLVDIEKIGETYHFRFEKLERFVSLCQKHGIEYYEMAHMFSQWGAAFAPNIMVTENGKSDYLFGWHTPARSEEYTAFLKQYIAAISAELTALGIAEKTYFHISDEPSVANMEKYAEAREIFEPLVGKSKIFDALSHIEFYEKGLVTTPVTIVSSIHDFLPYGIEDQWLYYCCIPETKYPNGFMAMPSARIRIIGYLMYKYNIKGFLHWGFNFYNSARSRYKVDPYLTTSADGAFPSGDGFIVYPAGNTVHSSIRGELMYRAIEDIRLATALEEKLGREAVIAMIDRAAGRDLRFDDYPADNAFFETIRREMMEAFQSL